jgi:hypothetical protein
MPPHATWPTVTSYQVACPVYVAPLLGDEEEAAAAEVETEVGSDEDEGEKTAFEMALLTTAGVADDIEVAIAAAILVELLGAATTLPLLSTQTVTSEKLGVGTVAASVAII